jgi:ergothioneine biosynthesis protein EgtB
MQPADGREGIESYSKIRAYTERICEPLETDDYQLQSILETSPPKWHIAHVTWFFETFLLLPYLPGYKPFHPRFAYLFNSYYETVGSMHPRPQRGMLSRPSVTSIYEYRTYVDEQMSALLSSLNGDYGEEILFRLNLGLNHEQQHQELLFMDIKHNFFVNPLKPIYRQDLVQIRLDGRPLNWLAYEGGVYSIGADDRGFHFDNETPRHRVLLNDYWLADRLVTNGEYLEFMEDGGYSDPRLWLADGWSLIHQRNWRHPLYWIDEEGGWQEFTLGGVRSLDLSQPLAHLSYYEADAYARWAGKRLPSEGELEWALAAQPVEGNFADNEFLHPKPATDAGQWYGDLWNWTASPYSAYPGFKPLDGSIGEYNGKFMANQMVLKGGSCATPGGHVRASYRNFFYPHDRWAFCGLRLAEDG